jgi:hypothetical protein
LGFTSLEDCRDPLYLWVITNLTLEMKIVVVAALCFVKIYVLLGG